jgi:hypothetical protein
MTSATERLRASDRRGGPPLGADPLAFHFEARCGVRPRCLLREAPEPTRSTAVVPSGTTGCRSHGARQGRNTLPSPTFGSGDAEAVRAARRNVQRELGGAMRAAASETSRSKAQGSIERSRDGNVARTQRTPRWKKALRSEAVQRAVATRKRARSNGERERQPVNATASERTRRGDGMVDGCRGGERFEGSLATGDDSWMDLRVHDLRVGGSAARPSQGVRNVANPMVGCGVQQTRRPSNE